MKLLGIMIRRRNRTNKKLLDKEIITLHSKLKKNDKITTHYTPKLHIYEFSLGLTKPPKQFQIDLIYKPLIRDMGYREER